MVQTQPYIVPNGTDYAIVLVQLSSSAPALFPLLLFFEFMVIALAGAFANARRVGYTNIQMWFSIAGLITSTSAFVLYLADGIINIYVVSVTVAITVGCVAWFFFTDDNM